MTTRETQVPALPAVGGDNLVEVLQAVKNGLDVREGRLGDPLDQFVTYRELKALGLVSDANSTSLKSVGGAGTVPVIGGSNGGFGPDNYNETTDQTVPPAPQGLTATGGYSAIYLSWYGNNYRNHAYTEIWRSTTDNLGSAVKIGTTIGNLYSDEVGTERTYFYWVRFVSQANVVGPYNLTSGTQASTALDVVKRLELLRDEILNDPLTLELGTRIQRIETSAGLNAEQIAALNAAKTQLQLQISNNGSGIVALDKTTATQATSIKLLGTRVGSAESSITNLQSTTATQATSLTNLTTRVGTAESNINNLQTTTSSQATSLTSLTTRVGTAESSITNLQTTTANQATSISQLNSTVSGNSTSIQTLTSTTNGLSGQYTVKIDNNGHVSGFGLASTATTAGVTSAFIVRADRFAIVGPNDTTDPLGTTNPTNVPFTVLTTPTVIGGLTYPAGVWMKSAFIADATITSAKIQSLSADKITAGTISAAIDMQSPTIRSGNIAPGTAGFYLGQYGGVNRFYVGNGSTGTNGRSLEFDGSNVTVRGTIYAYAGEITNLTARSLTIYDSNNNVILSSAGVNNSLISITNSQVSGLGTLATQNTVSSGQVTGLGALATQNTVSTGQVTGLGSLATQSSVFIGSTVRFADGSIMNTGDFVSRLSQINSSNISTFIASAAIGDAYIGNLNANKITAGTIAADRLDSGIITAKVANLQGAQIADAAITTAKIGTAQVDTLRIAGEAVTVPRFYETSTKYSATGVVLTYTFTMPQDGKIIVIWQGQTASARNYRFSIYLNSMPGGNSAYYDYVGPGSGDYEYDFEFNQYYYVGSGFGSYVYVPATPLVPDIGNTRTGGVFEDAPTAVGYGTVNAGSNTIRIYWQRENGDLNYQRLIILGAQR